MCVCVSVCVCVCPKAISAAFNGKYDRAQCRDRFYGQATNSAQRKGKWTAEENRKLIQVRDCVLCVLCCFCCVHCPVCVHWYVWTAEA